MHYATSIILQYLNTRTSSFQFTSFPFSYSFNTSNVQIQPPSCLVRVGPNTPSLIQIGNYVAPHVLSFIVLIRLQSFTLCRSFSSVSALQVPVPLASALHSPDARVTSQIAELFVPLPLIRFQSFSALPLVQLQSRHFSVPALVASALHSPDAVRSSQFRSVPHLYSVPRTMYESSWRSYYNNTVLPLDSAQFQDQNLTRYCTRTLGPTTVVIGIEVPLATWT